MIQLSPQKFPAMVFGVNPIDAWQKTHALPVARPGKLNDNFSIRPIPSDVYKDGTGNGWVKSLN